MRTHHTFRNRATVQLAPASIGLWNRALLLPDLTLAAIAEVDAFTTVELAVRHVREVAPITTQYGTSVEWLLVPGPLGVGLTAFATRIQAQSIAVAWTWGATPGGLSAMPANPQFDYRYPTPIIRATGFPATRWYVYARYGATAGDTGTLEVEVQLSATSQSSVPAQSIWINPECTVPPFVPGVKGALAGSIFPTPTPQAMLFPRQWRSLAYDCLIDSGAVATVARIGGGPWLADVDYAVTANGANNLIDTIAYVDNATVNRAVQGGQNINEICPVTVYRPLANALASAYPMTIAPNILNITMEPHGGAGAVDETATVRWHLNW